MIKKIICLIVLVCLASLLPPMASAQGGIEITDSSVQLYFPMSITFDISVQSSAIVDDIRLHYEVEQLGFADVIAEAVPVFTPSTDVDTRWTWDLRRIGGLPPGTVIYYWWTARDASGKTAQSEEEQIVFNDSRFTWQKIEADMITLYWYEGSNSFAQELLNTVQDAVSRLADDTGAYLREPIRLYIYASSNDLLGSMIYPQEWTGGVAFTRYGCIAIGISTLNLSWGKRAIAHELTHLVTHQMTLNPYNEIPVWLDEGLAMVNEGPMQPVFSSALENAINNDTLLSVQTLASPFSSYADISYLSYAESCSIVDYLINTYGKDRMFQLLDTFRQGSTYDGALKKVYGFDTAGLNTEWMETLDIPRKNTQVRQVPVLVVPQG